MLRDLLPALLFAALLAPHAARAAGSTIEHTPPSAKADEEATFTAIIRSPGGVFDPHLFWRPAGGGEYGKLALVPDPKMADRFAATLTPEGDLEYYLSAFDRKSLAEAFWKSKSAPQRLVVAPRPAPVAIREAPAPVEPPKPPGPAPALAATPPPAPAPPTTPPTPVAAAKPKPKLMVLEPTGETIPHAVLALLDDVVLTEVSKTGRFEVLGSSDVKRMLGALTTQQQLGCETMTDSCLTELGGALGAELLLNTTLGKLGTQYLVNMKLIDVAHARVVERRSEKFPADEDALGAAVPRMIASLFPPDAKPAGGSGAPWIALGTGGVAAAVYGVLAYGAVQANTAGDIDSARSRAMGANVSIGVAGVALAAALGFFLFDVGAGSGADAPELW